MIVWSPLSFSYLLLFREAIRSCDTCNTVQEKYWVVTRLLRKWNSWDLTYFTGSWVSLPNHRISGVWLWRWNYGHSRLFSVIYSNPSIIHPSIHLFAFFEPWLFPNHFHYEKVYQQISKYLLSSREWPQNAPSSSVKLCKYICVVFVDIQDKSMSSSLSLSGLIWPALSCQMSWGLKPEWIPTMCVGGVLLMSPLLSC